MSLLYADTSALIRAYFADESEHDELYAMLLGGDEPVVTSELARVEFGSAARAASRAGRLTRWRDVVARFDADCQDVAPIALLRLRPDVVMPVAHELVLEHRVGTLDALHLAVATTQCPRLTAGGDFVFVTRDVRQGEAAGVLGMAVR